MSLTCKIFLCIIVQDSNFARNWLREDCTTAFDDHSLVNDEGIIRHFCGTLLNCFSVNNKFFAWYSNSKAIIWKRHSLKIEEVFLYFLFYMVVQEMFLLN